MKAYVTFITVWKGEPRVAWLRLPTKSGMASGYMAPIRCTDPPVRGFFADLIESV